MTREQYATLASKYALHLLYTHEHIHMNTAEGCNLWILLQESLGVHDSGDNAPPIDEIVKYVTNQMGE